MLTENHIIDSHFGESTVVSVVPKEKQSSQTQEISIKEIIVAYLLCFINYMWGKKLENIKMRTAR